MEIRIETRPDHVLVVAKGEFDAAGAMGAIGRLVEACGSSGLDRVLVDGRSISSAVSVLHRYEFAKALAERAESRLRMAIVVSRENMFSKTLEDTAVNLGIDVHTTDSVAEALIYLGLPLSA